MDFWDRLKLEIKRNKKTQEGLSDDVSVPFGTFRRWMSERVMPNADQAYAIAQALGTTVEYLVTGEQPSSWIPPRLKPLVEDLALLDDTQLQMVGMMVKPLAEATRSAKRSETAG